MKELTERCVWEILEHEAIVQEAYKDSVGVWTWGVGVTDRSGHKVGRYKDNPQTIERCLEIYIWLLRTHYLPEVLKAFKTYELKEHELAAALSFHYNTGAILHSSWVRAVLADDRATAQKEFMEWCHPKEIISRRKSERDLFFNGHWTSDGVVIVYPVRKPSYSPDWRHAKMVNVKEAVRNAM